MRQQYFKQLLQMMALPENYRWGMHTITVAGTTYNSGTIPATILKEHPDLREYTITDLQSDDQLRSFIIYRLVEKLDHERERAQMDLTQEKVAGLILDDGFMRAFIRFLRAQTVAVAYVDLSSAIVEAFRKPDRQLVQSFKHGTPIRQENTRLVKRSTAEADRLWEQVVRRARAS